jgi:serine/threonine protein kinase/tetratricopeptide (TPR) repeat protein
MPLLPIGTILKQQFRIVSVLGEGGMGTVYKAEQVDRPGIYRAVKELLINPNTTEEERKAAIERWNKEIDLLYQLKHQRIPLFIVSFQEGGRYYFVMEFVPGKTLEQILENAHTPLDEDRVIQWMMLVCEALTYIHTRTPPIILRDLKPGNIMVTDDNEVHLIDFGIARRFVAGKQTNTENLGTVSYASPEHLGSIIMPGQSRAGQNPVKQKVQTDARSDLYSLGATMYHLLTNNEPDPIKTPAQGSILAKNPRLRTVVINGKIVCPVEQVIIKAMQQDPVQRFQSAEAMRVALQHCLLNQGAPTTIQMSAISPNSTIIVSTPVPTVGVICPKCGYQNRPGAKFCKRDGQQLMHGARAVPPQIRTAIAARPAAAARPVPQPIRARPAAATTTAPAAATRAASHASQAAVRPATPVVAPPASANSIPSASDPLAAYNLGLQFLNTHYLAEAINQFRQAQNAGMASYDLEYNLGRAYRQYGLTLKDKDKNQFTEQMKLAAEHFEQAISTRRETVDAYLLLGLTYNDLSLFDKANSAFSRALPYAPNNSALYFQLGTVAANRGYSREAEGYYLEGLRIKPDNMPIQLALGRLYLSTNQVKRAIAVFQQVTQRDPGKWEAWYELGRAHMKARQWKLALSALEQARQWNPDAAEVYNAMASCYLRTNNRAEARGMLREALQRDPNNLEAARLQKQL